MHVLLTDTYASYGKQCAMKLCLKDWLKTNITWGAQTNTPTLTSWLPGDGLDIVDKALQKFVVLDL